MSNSTPNHIRITGLQKYLRRLHREDIQSKNSVEQLLLEVELTDFIQNLINFLNTHFLKNFSFRLQMDCDEGQNERRPKRSRSAK
jgi:hypothetical protein